MIRKTFTDKTEARQYENEQREAGNIAMCMPLGEKFRVYAETKDETDKMKSWRRDSWTQKDTENYLRRIAWKEGDAIENALVIKHTMDDGTLYSDGDTVIEIARIMNELGELKSASDVFHFIDDTHHYDKIMRQIIDETLADCDYEAKEEVAKE